MRQRGESRELFPGGNLRGGKRSELRSPHISPSRSPFLGTLFGAYVVVGVALLVGRWILRYPGRQAEPMGEAGRESGPRSRPVPWFLWKSVGMFT